MKKFSDTYTNGEAIGHHDGETIKYSNKSITWNEMCCHHCGGTTLNFGHLSWGKLIEHNDNVTGTQELACTAGGCEI